MQGIRAAFRGWVEDGVQAAAEVLFPDNDLGVPSWRDTDLTRRTWELIEAFPPSQRVMVMGLFAALEVSPPLLRGKPRLFSQLSADERTRAIEAWRESDLFPLRLFGDVVKAFMSMVYMTHPDVLTTLGQFKSCRNPGDPFTMPLREGYFEGGGA